MMGIDILRRYFNYLADPYLVRGIQEHLGIKQISQDSAAAEEPTASYRRLHANNGTLHNATSSNKTIISGSQSDNTWLTNKTRKRVNINSSTSARGGVIIVETYTLLNVFFKVASELGHEPFYITYFPFVFWNVDSLIARYTVLLWCISMYIGQACKALFKFKRPTYPPVFQIDTNPLLNTEYGFPSTHATVAATIPFYTIYSLYHRYNMSMWIGIPIAIFWCSSICLSRIYLGVHTVLDILAGLFLAVVMLIIGLMAIPYIDWFMFDYDFTLIVTPLIVIVLLYIYPVEANKWSLDRSDTATILGVGFGIFMGFNICGRFPDDMDPGPFELVLPTLQLIGVSIVRFVVGVMLLLPTRFIMKLLCFKLLPFIMPTHGVQDVVKRPLVELPYKIITYGVIGFNAVYLVPYVFQICNISRF